MVIKNMNAKKVAILFLLGFCCVTVVPIVLMLLDAMMDSYERSILGRLISELE